MTDLKRGRQFAQLVAKYAPTAFSAGALPTGPAFQVGSTGFLDEVTNLYPEFAEDAGRMKWSSTGFVPGLQIFFRADVIPGRIGVGVITARAGDGELTQEWIVGSTDGDPLEAYYNPEPGVNHGRHGHPINELAAKAQKTGDLGAFKTAIAGKPRLTDHKPTAGSISEPEGRTAVDRLQVTAKKMRPSKRR